MKYLHSFWSKPLEKLLQDNSNGSKTFAGFPNKLSFLCAWSYSCLSIKKYYPNLHLVTDDLGVQLFIEQLRLPYVTASKALNDLHDLPPYLWAFGKLYAYKLQQEPFCHIDGDVFLFGSVLDSVIERDLFFQSFDHHTHIFSKIHKTIHENGRNIPKDFYAELSSDMKCINAGVIGGNRIDIIKSYVDQAFELIRNNQHLLSAEKSWELNLYCEQFLISNIIDKYNIDCGFVFSEPDENNRYNFAAFESIPEQSQYVHLYFNKKRKTQYIEQIVARLQIEYPEYYERILTLV
jgi:hypothetical protein